MGSTAKAGLIAGVPGIIGKKIYESKTGRGILMGSDARQVGKANLMTREQQQFLKSLLGNLGGGAEDTLAGLLSGQPVGAQEIPGFEDQFQQGVVDPAVKTYQENILPALEQRYADVGAGSSSVLNNALSKSAEDFSSLLASQRIPYQQSQQQNQLGQQQLLQQGQMGALQGILNLLSQKAYQPIVQGPQAGLLKDLISGGASLGSAAIMASSIKIKENIRRYEEGLDTIRVLNVEQYDYKIPVEGRQTDRIGLIAEHLPEDLQAQTREGINGVDLYALVSVLVNAVKQLDIKIQQLEAR